MFSKNRFFSFLFIISFLTLAFACSHQTTILQIKLGDTFYQKLQASKEITFFRVNPKEKGSDFLNNMSHRPLNEKQIEQLKSLVLNDEHYLFDKKKKALFVPQMGFKVDGDQKITILVSTVARKMKFLSEDHALLLDYDPMFEEFSAFLNDLTEELSAN